MCLSLAYRELLVDMLLDEVLSSSPVDVDGDQTLLAPSFDQLIHFDDQFLNKNNI
jgi:hypothetical protein